MLIVFSYLFNPIQSVLLSAFYLNSMEHSKKLTKMKVREKNLHTFLRGRILRNNICITGALKVEIISSLKGAIPLYLNVMIKKEKPKVPRN